MLESVDESFDHVAELIPFAIVTARSTIATRWDDRLSAARANLLAQRIAIVPLVGYHVLGFEAFQQDFGAGHVMAFPFGQMQLDRLALAINRDVDFRAEPPTDRGRGTESPPPTEPCRRISRTRLSSWWFYL
jgi:hypothetical protein